MVTLESSRRHQAVAAEQAAGVPGTGIAGARLLPVAEAKYPLRYGMTAASRSSFVIGA